MTNNEIIQIIKNEYKLNILIKKLISNSIYDYSHDDLEQYIYLYLLEYDNVKLNGLYDRSKCYKPSDSRNELRKFICRIVLNQRNLYKSVYNKNFKLFDNEYLDNMDVEEQEQDKTGEIIKIYLYYRCDFNPNIKYTKDELLKIRGFNIFRNYINSGNSIHFLANNLHISYTTIWKHISSSRQEIKDWWYSEGKYLDDEYIKKNEDKL